MSINSCHDSSTFISFLNLSLYCLILISIVLRSNNARNKPEDSKCYPAVKTHMAPHISIKCSTERLL